MDTGMQWGPASELEPGSVPDGLERSRGAWANVEERAVAFLRDYPDVSPEVEQTGEDEAAAGALWDVPDGDLDLGTIVGVCEAKRRGGVLPDRFNQSRAQFDEHVARFRASRNAELWRGKARPASSGRVRISPLRQQRPRERRNGSRRNSIRGPTTGDDSESEPSDGERVRRLCQCGCRRDISHRHPSALTFDASCRKRLSRARMTVEDPEFVPVRRAGLTHATGRRCEAESCGCLLSRYGGAGVLCWTCAFAKLSDPQDPSLDETLVGLTSSDPLAEVLIAVGALPRACSRVVAFAAKLNVPLSDAQAARLIESYGGSEGACDALAGMVDAKRRQLEAMPDVLPKLYSFGEYKTRHSDRAPSEQITAFLALPAWQRDQAWSTLVAEIDRKRGALVTA